MNAFSQDDALQQEIVTRNQTDSKPILIELSQAGFDVDWVSDLYNRKLKYKNVIPILLNWLPRTDNFAVKESIIRALSVSWARNTIAQNLLVEEFRKQGYSPGQKWAIGYALSVVADDSISSDLIDLIRDDSFGKAREMLVVALGNVKKPGIEEFLVDLVNDDDFVADLRSGYSG